MQIALGGTPCHTNINTKCTNLNLRIIIKKKKEKSTKTYLLSNPIMKLKL